MANKDVKIQIKAVNKTKKAFMAVTAGLKSISRAAFSMKSAIGLAAGAVGLGYLVKKSMDATDSMAKVSRSIGISVTELQRLRHAASIGGLEAKSLDKAMQKLAINISDVASGTGIAKEAFDRYGISSTNIDGSTRSVTDVLGQAATALETMTNETDRASFVYDLFGARGAKVINMLKDGKDAMEAMKKEADELGLVMSLELIEGVENANDSIARLSDYLGNVFHRVVASIAPIIESASEAVRSFVEMKINKQGGITAFSKNIAITILEAASAIVTASTSMLNSIGRIANGAGRSIQKVLEFLPASLGGLKTLESIELKLLDIAIQRENLLVNGKSNRALKERLKSLDAQELVQTRLIESGNYLESIEPFKNFNTNGAVLEINELLMKMKEVNIASDEVVGASKSSEMTNAFHLEYDLAFAHQRKMGELRQDYLGREKADRSAAYGVAFEQQRMSSRRLENFRRKDADDLKEESRGALASLSSHYKAAFAINKAFAVKDALVNTYNGVAKAMNNPFPLNLGFAAVALANGMAQVAAIKSTQFRANGGPMSAGSPYIVGERGPELIVPNQAANVVPNDQLGGGNFTINISANDTAGFDDLLTKRRGTLMNLINQSLNERGRPALA
jgi:hypothetical protein